MCVITSAYWRLQSPMSRQCRVKRKGHQKCQITAFGTHHVCIRRISLEQRRNNGASQKYDACVKGQRAFLLLPCRHFHPLISHETDDLCATCPPKSCAHVYSRPLVFFVFCSSQNCAVLGQEKLHAHYTIPQPLFWHRQLEDPIQPF